MKAETRDGLDSKIETEQVSVKSVYVTPGSSGDVTDDDLLRHSEDEEGEIYSDSSIHTLVQETLSDMDDDFDPDLPTEFGIIDQATPSKDVVVEKENTEIDDGKSEKKVPVLVKKESTESGKVSQPSSNTKILNIKTKNVKEETEVRLHDEKFLIDLSCKTMVTKNHFKDSSHLKSVRYYLPEYPPLTMEGRKSGLLANLTMTASIYTCAANYQHCYSEAQIVRLRSKSNGNREYNRGISRC